MRFLLLNQFYPPDPAPTGCYLHQLALELVRRGHHVKVLCSRRSYSGGVSFHPRENIEGVEVSRLAATGFGRRGFVGKIADYATFYLTLAGALALERSKADLILSLTTPPYLGLLAKAAAAGRGCWHAHWIMDLYPDVMFANRPPKRKGLAFRALQYLTRFQLRGAQTVISLGAKMGKNVARYAPNNRATEVFAEIPLWSDPALAAWPANQSNPLRIARGWNNDIVFLYSGNMGLGHRFAEFLEAAKRLGSAGPRWVFSGSGKRRAEIESFAQSQPAARIEFLDYVPKDQLSAHLSAADVHLASLDPAWQGLMVPSKIQASFAVGRPVLFVGGRQSETAVWLEESGGGWVVEQNNADALLAAINEALNPEQRRRRGQAALAFARKHFQMSDNCARIIQLLEGRRVPSSLTTALHDDPITPQPAARVLSSRT